MNEYIILYADDFKKDIWEEYCNILKYNPNAYAIKIFITSSEEVVEEEE